MVNNIKTDGIFFERMPQLKLRNKIFRSIRDFFYNEDFLEVETPYIIPSPIPELHIDAIHADKNKYLHTSSELCMKRLLVNGYLKIFQISKCFRAGERGHRHLSEFTMLEWYRAYEDYYSLMDDCEHIFCKVAMDINGNLNIDYNGVKLNLAAPWERLTVKEAFTKYAGTTYENAIEKDIFDEILIEKIEPNLGIPNPTFLYDYPSVLSSLARLKSNSDVAERVELYVGGIELANGFSELTDPVEQRRRFEREFSQRVSLGKELYPVPEKFLTDIGSMPESAGMALGLDRLVMLFADTDRIDDVVSFIPEDL